MCAIILREECIFNICCARKAYRVIIIRNNAVFNIQVAGRIKKIIKPVPTVISHRNCIKFSIRPKNRAGRGIQLVRNFCHFINPDASGRKGLSCFNFHALMIVSVYCAVITENINRCAISAHCSEVSFDNSGRLIIEIYPFRIS